MSKVFGRTAAGRRLDHKLQDDENIAESLELQYDYKENTGKATITKDHGLDF
jgi:hypothetical protein